MTLNFVRIKGQFRWAGLFLVELLALSLLIMAQSPVSALAYGGRTPGAVVAFYYPWYDQRDPDVWNPGKMSSLPSPKYDSRDLNFVRGQMERARNAGIDSFAVTWNGPTGDWADRFKAMLDSAGNGFTVAVHFETSLMQDKSVNKAIENLRYIRDNYMNSPKYLHYEGKPVLFFWRAEDITSIDNWQNIRNQVDPNHEQIWSIDGIDASVLRVFDGLHLFSAAKWDDNPVAKYKQFRNDVNGQQSRTGQRKYWLAGVTPGYDDRKYRQPGEFRDRAGGGYYDKSWQAAIGSTPDMVTISTWNEWYEGSSIEPGEAWGNLYVDKTTQYTNQYKGTTKSFGDASIMKVWSRTDLPVNSGAVQRTWMWGPENFDTLRETYREGPGGSRIVYYFDKSRMEITRPNGDPNAQFFVTNGLLVREMMRGKIQVGDDPNAEEGRSPAAVPVAGDLNNNPNSPTFASMAGVASLAGDKRVGDRTGQVIDQTMAGNGQVGQTNAFGTRYSYYEGTLGHNIAQPFWDFFQQNGPVFENANLGNGQVVDWLFAMGYPITDPFWAKVRVDGQEKDVLIQAFERRIMTYTPSNGPGFQVEMGNVGLQYHKWRYGK
jgi:hypothetical protein